MSDRSRDFHRPIWDDFDGTLFEELARDLLTAEGFEVEPSGVGPDGGVDAFAMQRIVFGYNNPDPFVWAVQCKFTSNPKRTIKPSDLGPILNIVSDERFSAKNISGYFLITNGRLSTNMVGELRGLNGKLPGFKTTWWDRPRLHDTIDRHVKVFTKYFKPKPAIHIRPDKKVAEEFVELVNSPATREVELLAFFDAHPEVLFPGSRGKTELYTQLALEFPSGESHVPDFLVKGSNALRWSIIEIKRPSAPLVISRRGRPSLSSKVIEALVQLKSYREYFELSENRQAIKDKYGIDVFRPKMIVVIGRDYDDLSLDEIIALNTIYPEVEILTYNEILRRLFNDI